MEQTENRYEHAATLLHQADALLVATGAGMGVDSGLPDFRGPEGFWTACPAYRDAGLDFKQLARPSIFRHQPDLAWGCFGHMLQLFESAQPHAGYDVLMRLRARTSLSAFVYTSNIDNHLQRAGWPEDCLCEIHGSLRWLQDQDGRKPAWYWDDTSALSIDGKTLRAFGTLPFAPDGSVARPNIMLFDDFHFETSRQESQLARYDAWRETLEGNRLVILEIGCGKAVSTLRTECETMALIHHAPLIRINPGDTESDNESVLLIQAPAQEALRNIEAAMA